MIGRLTGTVAAKRAGCCILEIGGVGYRVAMTKESLARLSEGAEHSCWTYLAVREDALDLYGFAKEEELSFFEKLLSVSGIGPKSALAVMDLAQVETLREAVGSGNTSYLTKVAGIGKKTAEKIVLELKEKVGGEGGGTALQGDEDALEAMRALGYTLHEARAALKKVPNDVASGQERLRQALRRLGS